MTIDELNLAEIQLLSRVRKITGLIEEKNLNLQESGIFSEYGKIYENYVELIESKNEGNEALKRAVFLMWFENSEPSFLTGIYELSPEMSQKVLQSLEHKIEVGTLDFEFEWMLPYYNTINDWIFDGYVDWVFGKKVVFPNIKKFLSEADYEIKLDLDSKDFMNRGQMGDYWMSILNSNSESRINNNKS